MISDIKPTRYTSGKRLWWGMRCMRLAAAAVNGGVGAGAVQSSMCVGVMAGEGCGCGMEGFIAIWVDAFKQASCTAPDQVLE